MCSFLLTFLIFAIAFSLFQDFAQENVRYPEAQGQAQKGSGPSPLVFAQNWESCSISSLIDSCQARYQQASFQGSGLLGQNYSRDSQRDGCGGCLSMGLPMWKAQQKDSQPMCSVLVSLDQGQEARRHSKAADLWGRRKVGNCLARMGARMGKLESGLERFRKCRATILTFTEKACASTGRLFTSWEELQRQEQGQRQEQRKGQKREQCKPVWPWKRKFYAVALMAVMESSGGQCIAIPVLSVQQERYYAGNGCSSTPSLQREGGSGRCASIPRQSRKGAQQKQHQVLASCHQEPGSSSEGTERCRPGEKGASASMDKTCWRRSQNLGGSARELQGASGLSVRTGQQGQIRNRIIQEDIERSEREFHEGRQPLNPSADFGGNGGRQHGQCCRPRRAKVEGPVARCVESMRWITWSSGSRSSCPRSVRRGKGTSSAAQETKISGACNDRPSSDETVTKGRGFPVLKNGSHEAHIYMFPNGHSVVGEKDYLSPIAAIWQAWELRCDLILYDVASCCEVQVVQSQSLFRFDSSHKSALRNSQGPQSVQRHLKRVHFDDRIEFVAQAECAPEYHSVFVFHNALQDWIGKPWYYCRKPPTRRFSWRKLTNLSFPFCSFVQTHGDAQSVCSNPDEVKSQSRTTHDESPMQCFSTQHSGHVDGVLTDITNTVVDECKFPNQISVDGAPLSNMAVLSSRPNPKKHVYKYGKGEKVIHDTVSIVQMGRPSIVSLKNAPHDLHQAVYWQPFNEGNGNQENDEGFWEDWQAEESDGYSPSEGAAPSNVHPPSSDEGRQDVMLFHLRDQPIRAMINWNSYEEMVSEIANHMALPRDAIHDVYEVVTAPPDLGNEVVPIIVHVHGDMSPTSTERLVLFDIDLHAHRIEHNFRSGPITERGVFPIRQVASRNVVLSLANIDRYCRAEGDRCLVFLNGRRWPDYDTDSKTLAHGDYIRIAVPPSERFVCSTSSISDMTQRGLSDQQIIDEIFQDDAASGFSPSLLGDDEVRDLAVMTSNDLDEVTMMQRGQVVVAKDQEADNGTESQGSSSDNIPPGWRLDLHMLAENHARQCQQEDDDEPIFTICTWYLDHEIHHSCREPQVVFLGGDPSEWREDLLDPWKHRIRPDDTVLIDLVRPYTQRPGVESCIAHVIITQRPSTRSSVLFSAEFVGSDGPSVFVRTAVAAPLDCTTQDLCDLVPVFQSFFLNRREWVHPLNMQDEQAFKTSFGMGIQVKIFPANEVDQDHSDDAASMIQNHLSQSAQAYFQSIGQPDQSQNADLKSPPLSDIVPFQVNMFLDSEQTAGHPGMSSCSLTDEFIRYVQAVDASPQDPVVEELPEGMQDQPLWVQDLWEKWTEILDSNGGDRENGLRIETWYTHPNRYTRCESPRVAVLSSHFRQWERELLAVWFDKAEVALPTNFAIVFPTPEDADPTVQEQLVIEQQPEPFSRSVVFTIYDTGIDRGRPKSQALVMSDRLEVSSVIMMLGYAEYCPPERISNECLLWMGNTAIRPDQTLIVRTGNALRFLIRRGIRIGVPELLSMSDSRLRIELQAAISGEIFRRPNVQGFPADPHSNNNPVSVVAAPMPVQNEYPPDWLNSLQEAFDWYAVVENSDEGPIIYILVWFVHGVHKPVCTLPNVVRLDRGSGWWRSEITFPWRDSIVRGQLVSIHFVDPAPPTPPGHSHVAHVIISQAVSSDQVAVLLTGDAETVDAGAHNQAAIVVNQFAGISDFLRLAKSLSINAQDVAVQRGRQVFPDSFTVRVGNGDGITAYVTPSSSSDVTSANQNFASAPMHVDASHSGENQVDISTGGPQQNDPDTAVEDVMLMQNLGTLIAAHDVNNTEAEASGPACALDIQAEGPQENEFFQFNPQAEEFRPNGQQLPEWAQVIEDIYHDWDINAFAWQGEARATYFMSWYVAPGIGRVQCQYGRRIALFADFWNWREQFRQKWIDEVDQQAEIQLVYVDPPPTHMEPGIVGHVILLQFNSPEWSSFLLSISDPAINSGFPFKMVHAMPEQLQMQQIIVRTGYTAECVQFAQCRFRIRGQHFTAQSWIRAADGDAIDFLVQRHTMPGHWNPPFIPHAPGAEGLALLQTQTWISRGKADTGVEESARAAVEPKNLLLETAVSIDASDIENIPFTLAAFFSQEHVRNADPVICIWEINGRNSLFEMHQRNGFDPQRISSQFRKEHNLIEECSPLIPVRFMRPSWNMTKGQWYVGSFVRPSSGSVVVACVEYGLSGAVANVVTLPVKSSSSMLRAVLNIKFGTIIRCNGDAIGETVVLSAGDTLEYHSSVKGPGIKFDRHCNKVQLCLEASLDQQFFPFDDEKDAIEVLQFHNLKEALIAEDEWSFCFIPEGVDLHKTTIEALHQQQDFPATAPVECELYIDGATYGEISAWAVVAVAVTRHGRVLQGCIGGITEIDPTSSCWIGAENHTNIDAELSAMAVATAFAFFGSVDRKFVIRPDLALSRRFLHLENTSRHGSVLVRLVHTLGQLLPNNVSVAEVRAHQGDPWNELADAVAKLVARKCITVGHVPWGSMHRAAKSQSTLKWEWLRHESKSFSSTMPVLHGEAVWQPTDSNRIISACIDETRDCPANLTVFLKAVTYNGLALTENDQSITTAGTRTVRLDSQFHQVRATLVGIQEARTSEGCRQADHYKIFSSGFEQCGRARHFGCELWIHKFLPFCKRTDGSNVGLQDCKTTVTVSESRLLIVKFEGPLNFTVVVAHAPCVSAERPIDQVRLWWHRLTGQLEKCSGGNMIFLIDANAPLADRETPFFGLHQCEASNPQGLEFQDFLITNELFAPSTFPAHKGAAATWRHPRGDWLRRDYVLLSRSFFLLCTDARTIADFDGGFGHIDHCPASCTMEGIVAVGSPRKKFQWDYQKMQDPKAQQAFADSVATLPMPSWSTSIDDHSIVVETNLLQLARQHFGTMKRERSRPVLKQATIAGIQLKRQALDMARSQNFQDQVLLDELKALEKVIKPMVLRDQRDWYAEWLDQINSAGQSHDTAQLYKRLQRLGRRKKDLGKGPRPLPCLRVNEEEFAQSFVECQQLWRQQFAQIEAGVDVTELQLMQLHKSMNVDVVKDLDMCPDPSEVLSIIRKFKNGKVPGPGNLPVDVIKSGGIAVARALTPLLVKAAWHMREPLSWKGGLLVPLFKGKGSPNDPQAYRSIFLSDICAKIHHAKVRKTLASVWSEDASLIQLGGKKGCSTDIAHHMLHAHLSWVRATTKSCAILFVDLQAAFYSVLRASFFDGNFHDDAICFAMQRLGITPNEWQTIKDTVVQDHATKGLGEHNEGILRDMFAGTHFSMHGLEGQTATMRGTRPGDPVADILFNMAFRLVMLDARSKIEDLSGMTCFGSPKPATDVTHASPMPDRGFAEITFVDDVAYSLHSSSAADVIASLQLISSCLHDVAASRGLAINYQAGKTEAIVKLAGTGSAAVKHQVWHECGGKLPIVTEHGTHRLQLVHAYKHLGSYVQDHAVIQKDLRYRNAQARKAYGQLSRQFYTKRNVHDSTKCEVYTALVLSRHAYNVHTWAWVTAGDLEQWENGIRSHVISLARNAIRPISPFHFTTAELCAIVGMQSPLDTLHANRLRYVKRAIQVAPAYLWSLLHNNAQSQSWFPQLMQSFAWIVRHSKRGRIPEVDHVNDMLSFIAMDQNWKGKVKAALKSCKRFREENAKGKLWTLKVQKSISSLTDEQSSRVETVGGMWKCNLCDDSFSSKKALAVHARHKHQYRTIMKYYIFGDECHACCKKFFSRARLLAHVHASTGCKDTYLACFVPASEDFVCQVEEEERNVARDLRAQGWRPSKAFLPVIRIYGPPLPESGTEGSVIMQTRWQTRIQVTGRAYEGLDGFCEHSSQEGDVKVEILPFIMQSNGGRAQGHAGIFQTFGLAAETARLHVNCFLFVHFFSGHRRTGDLQHSIESHEVCGCQQIFCISVDLCLAKSHSDLTDEATKQFWIGKMRGGQILGIGGGPSCETWSAARHMTGGPPPIRSFDAPWGCPGLSGRQWKQLVTGTKLIQFLVELLVIAAQIGLCGFFEHPQFPVWLMRQRPASVWTLDAMRALIRLECFQACSFDQCVYGLDATKPTTLLLLRLSTFRDLTLTRGNRGRCSHYSNHKPLQGIQQDGSFATARAKIYPMAMNRALATAVSRFLAERNMQSMYNRLPEDLQELVTEDYVDESVVQPDYHR